MQISHIVVESFQDYYKPHLLIAMPFCSFKCWKEYTGTCENFCQNSHLKEQITYDISPIELINHYYMENTITKSVVFGGLEPFDSFDDIFSFIKCFRDRYSIADDVVIYTGYKEEEIKDKINQLKKYPNIIVKFGRYIPDTASRYDTLLKVNLVSSNQYAVKIS